MASTLGAGAAVLDAEVDIVQEVNFEDDQLLVESVQLELLVAALVELVVAAVDLVDLGACPDEVQSPWFSSHRLRYHVEVRLHRVEDVPVAEESEQQPVAIARLGL